MADHAPFDAILLAAGGPAVPEALKEQLTVGGRLVIPLGEELSQSPFLCKVIRRTETSYEETDLGAVRFVPFIGEQGWAEDGRRAASSHKADISRKQSLPQMIAEAAEDLPDFEDAAFGRLFDRFANRRVILLGEASHGTAELYRARRDHPLSDRPSWLHDRGGRSRLAGRGHGGSVNFKRDLSSDAAEKVPSDLKALDLPTINDFRDEFEKKAADLDVSE